MAPAFVHMQDGYLPSRTTYNPGVDIHPPRKYYETYINCHFLTNPKNERL